MSKIEDDLLQQNYLLKQEIERLRYYMDILCKQHQSQNKERKFDPILIIQRVLNHPYINYDNQYRVINIILEHLQNINYANGYNDGANHIIDNKKVENVRT